jgi:hypothetical protein
MEILISLHNLFRWVVLALGFLAVLGALKNNAKPLRIYAIFITLQFLLGLVLWLNFLYLYGFKTKEFLVRFFILEHPFLMTLSVIFSHVALARSKKGGNLWKILTVISMILLIVGIPWWRPIIRL